jgi:hypothetical protein
MKILTLTIVFTLFYLSSFSQTTIQVLSDETWRVFPSPYLPIRDTPTLGWKNYGFNDLVAPWQNATLNRAATGLDGSGAGYNWSTWCDGSVALGSTLTPLIWYESDSVHNAYDEAYFRKSFNIPCENLSNIIESNTMIDMYADDNLTIFINGNDIGSVLSTGIVHINASVFSPFLVSGNNQISVHAKDGDPNSYKCVGWGINLIINIQDCNTNHIESNLSNNDNLSLYPNPASDKVFIKNNGSINGNSNSLHIYSLDGKELINIKLTSENYLNTPILLNQFEDGLYFYKIVDAQNNLFNSGKIRVEN